MWKLQVPRRLCRRGTSACRKSLFAPLSQFSELYKSSENCRFEWRRETAEALPVAEKARLFRGSGTICGKKPQIVMPRRCIPSWVIYAPSAAALRRLRSETRLRAQSRAHPSLPLQKTYHFIDSLALILRLFKPGRKTRQASAFASLPASSSKPSCQNPISSSFIWGYGIPETSMSPLVRSSRSRFLS